VVLGGHHELAQALKTIAELEAVKAASALFNGEEPISPKAVPGCPKPEQPGLHGALRMPDPGVSRHCYYEFKYHVPSDRQIRGLLLSGLVANIHKRSRGSYGMLRIRAALMLEQNMVGPTGSGGRASIPSWPTVRQVVSPPRGTSRSNSKAQGDLGRFCITYELLGWTVGIHGCEPPRRGT
jgi:hypothetical protein